MACTNHSLNLIEVHAALLERWLECQTSRSDASFILSAMHSFVFLCYIGYWNGILVEVKETQLYLQTKSLHISSSSTKFKALETFLVENKDDFVHGVFTFGVKNRA